MTDREVWTQAGAIVVEHGALTADYIIDQVSDAIGDRVAVEDWCRITKAVDMFADVNRQ